MANREEKAMCHDHLFKTTCWTDLGKVGGMPAQHCRAAIERLTSRYWKPVYVFLYRKGYRHEDALDLTQGFFHEIVLERRLFQQADQSKGRFRTYLLTILQRYVAEQFRKANAKKRVPSSCVTSLASSDLLEILSVESEATPEQIFQYIWAAELLDQALNEIRQEYCTNGKAAYWHVFHDKVVIPTLDGNNPPSLSELCRTYDVTNEKKVSNMIITAKRRFQGILKRILSETMESDSTVEDELAELISILSQGSAA
jgi:DNA-directed RNA polymerase specialized sigma24 family protein